MRTTCRSLLAAAILLASLEPATAAGAAGPPLPSWVSGKAGVTAPGVPERFVAERAGAGTVVRAVRRSDGAVLRSRTIAGRWTVPAVTLEGATTGLSADGRTLVLSPPSRNLAPRRTRLAIVDARALAVRRTITLKGFFTVDAVAPDGRRLYLVHYPGQDIFQYRVRVLDTRTGRLERGDVVDPREPEEQMGGLAMGRTVSRDGRWFYTLYGGGAETFVHALDTVGRTAACIDLEMLPTSSDLSGVELQLVDDDRGLLVSDGGKLVATVDTRTFEVNGGAPEEPPASAPAAPASSSGGGGGVPWLLPAGLVVLLCAAAALWRPRRLTARR